MADDLLERLRAKRQMMPVLGGGSISSGGTASHYITDDGMRHVNPDGPEAAARIEAQSREIEGLREAIDKLSRCLVPVTMGLAQAECVDEPIPDACVVLSFMGSGASDAVTAGEVREALEAAGAALTRDTPVKEDGDGR